MLNSNYDDAPSHFVTMCRLAGISQKEIEIAWGKVKIKTWESLLNWLILNAGLSDSQLDQLDNLFTAIKEEKEVVKNRQNFLDRILDERQEADFNKKYFEILMANLGEYYEKIIATMSVEQRQVLRAMEQESKTYA